MKEIKDLETETIDKLFLELSQITKAKTAREAELEKRLRNSPNPDLEWHIAQYRHLLAHRGFEAVEGYTETGHTLIYSTLPGVTDYLLKCLEDCQRSANRF